MTCKRTMRGDLDAYVMGELADEKAHNLQAHLFECQECARELRLLRAEKRVFRARAENIVDAAPPFESVLAQLSGASVPARPAHRADTTRSKIGPIAVAFAALAAAAASWVGATRGPIDTQPPHRTEATAVEIEPENICAANGGAEWTPALMGVAPEQAENKNLTCSTGQPESQCEPRVEPAEQTCGSCSEECENAVDSCGSP
ncbi:MAG: zf-HC2 domain-containing protein [Polyangiaceae bacterium]|nr:zf-HC2 domain-containing protein [Polyangiaceae bacterium]